MAVCVVLIPLSLWCLDLANHALFPSRVLVKIFGPEVRTRGGSAPDYMEWDIATMLLMLVICGVSVLYLALQITKRLRRTTSTTEE